MEPATRIYVDEATKLKRGSRSGETRGSPDGLTAVIKQFDLIWDVVAADTDELLGLLPAEFKRFKA